VCVSLSAISYNSNPLQLQSIGRIRTKKQRKRVKRRGYNLCIHLKEHGYENISLVSDGLGSHPVTVFRYDNVKHCVSMAESKLLTQFRPTLYVL
jgi:hypothetical protein